MSKTLMLDAVTGAVAAGVGANTLTVSSWDIPIGIVIEPNRLDDKVAVVRRSLADDRWVPVTDDKGPVILSSRRNGVSLCMPDTYALQGHVQGTITAYKVVE